MRISWISAGIGVALMLTLAACKSESSGTGGAGVGGSGGTPSTGGSDVGGSGPGGSVPGVDCACACDPGGAAALVCNDPAHPSFCAGMQPVAGGMCEMKLLMDCGFTAADISDFGCSD